MKNTRNLALGAALLCSPAALAYHPDAALVIDNDTGRPAEVFVDGKYTGTVRPRSEITYPVKSAGREHIVVRNPDGLVLVDRVLDIRAGGSARIEVVPPLGTLMVVNQGRLPLKVTVANTSEWIRPGANMQLKLATGRADIYAEVLDRYGTYVVDRESVVVQGGRISRVTVDDFKYASLGASYPPPPRPVVVGTVTTTSSCASHGHGHHHAHGRGHHDHGWRDRDNDRDDWRDRDRDDDRDRNRRS